MAEQGRIRQPVQQKPIVDDNDDSLTHVEDTTVDPIQHMKDVFTDMKKHFDKARAEALQLPNSDELAAMLAHLNMAEVAMDGMVNQAEGSLV